MKGIKKFLTTLAAILMVVALSPPAFADPKGPPPATGIPPATPGKTTGPPLQPERTSPAEKLAPPVPGAPTDVPVPHEFSTIPGITEDVTDIILNLRPVVINFVNQTRKFDNQRGQVLDKVQNARDVEQLWSVLNAFFSREDWWQLYQAWIAWTTRVPTRDLGRSHPAPPTPPPGQQNEFGLSDEEAAQLVASRREYEADKKKAAEEARTRANLYRRPEDILRAMQADQAAFEAERKLRETEYAFQKRYQQSEPSMSRWSFIKLTGPRPKPLLKESR